MFRAFTPRMDHGYPPFLITLGHCLAQDSQASQPNLKYRRKPILRRGTMKRLTKIIWFF